MSEAPPIVSGISRCIDRLTQGLQSRGHLVDVISAMDIPRMVLGEIRISSFGLFWPRIARRLSQYDIVNLHGPAPTMSDVFLLLNRLSPGRRRPQIVYTHHSAIEISGVRAACAVYNRVHEGLARTADRIIVTSRAYRDLLARPLGPTVEVVPWGVDGADSSLPRPLPKTGPLKVLFVGQMRPYKGVDTLLRAVAGQPALSVTLVGSGPLLDQYRARARAAGATNATFTGRVSDEELQAHYRAHDVVVLPSTTRAEAFGLVLLEGMAAGCVPVASDLPGVRDVASPTGFVVPPRDPHALRRALLSLSADPARLHHLQQVSQEAARRMGWSRVVERYEQAFVKTVEAWQARQPRALPTPWASGRLTLTGLVEDFKASSASLLLFRRGHVPRVAVAWGSATLPERRLAQRTWTAGRPQLLDPTTSDSDLTDLMTLAGIGSAMSVPFSCRAGMTGVLNLSLASTEERAFTPYDLERLVGLLSSDRRGELADTSSHSREVASDPTGH
ncbi:glycosyltransferase family 4 protein [Micromonospora rhizosphaerae]|uniref:glycosyltransferase family 4 protein n=1 Tax=Micromonospora rhizosphaerae TaxID=568872 RepID=UPI00114CE8B1|nr:glycosyltransferase family 4 protein [Micromonospora rhizosphaerae]